MGKIAQHDMVSLVWPGPYSFAEALKFENRCEDVGIYQVCGPHVSYGCDSLLYIGHTKQQTFSKRLGQERWQE
jgi:hypothetical protein